MKRLLVLIALLAMFAMTALGADIAGTWKATSETPNGTMERTFIFKVDGNKLTGETSSSIFGTSPIEDGKIDGDNITFIITAKYEGNEYKLNYKGKVSGKEIKLSVEIPQAGQTLEWIAKKVE